MFWKKMKHMVLGPPAYVSDPSVPEAASGLEIKEAILVDLPSQEAVQLWDRIEALLGDVSIRAIKVEDLELRPDDSEGRLLFVLDGQKDLDDSDLIESLRADGLEVPVVTLYSGEQPAVGRGQTSGVVELALDAPEQSLRACLHQLGVAMKLEPLESEELAVEQQDELVSEIDLDLAGAREALIAESESSKYESTESPLVETSEKINGEEVHVPSSEEEKSPKDDSATELETPEPMQALAEKPADFQSRLEELMPKLESLDLNEQELLRSLREVQRQRSQLCQRALDSAWDAEERADGYRVRLEKAREERLNDHRQTFTAKRALEEAQALNRSLEEENAKASEVAAAEAVTHEELSKAQSQIEGLENDLADRAGRAEKVEERLQEELSQSKVRVRELKNHLESTEGSLKDAPARLAALESDLDAAQSTVKAEGSAQQELEASQARVTELEGELKAAESQATEEAQAQDDLKTSLERVGELESELKASEGLAVEAEGTAQENLRESQARVTELEAELETAQVGAESESRAQEELAASQARVLELEIDLESAKSAVQTAADLQPQAETLEAESRELRAQLSEAFDRIQELETPSLAVPESSPTIEHETLKLEQVLPMPGDLDESLLADPVIDSAETQIFWPQVLEGGAGLEDVMEGDKALANLRDELRDLA